MQSRIDYFSPLLSPGLSIVFLILFPVLHLTSTAFAEQASPPIPSCSDISLTSARIFATATLHPGLKGPIQFQPIRGGSETIGSDSGDPILHPEQRIIISDEIGNWVCAHRPEKMHVTSGWLPTAKLSIRRELPIPVAGDWVGSWHKLANPEHQIASIKVSLSTQKGMLTLDGVAGSPSSMGSVEGTAKPGSIYLGITEMGCRIVMIWIDGLMIVDDIYHDCSGPGVDFAGVYRRQDDGGSGQ